jgi:hypothetical protein
LGFEGFSLTHFKTPECRIGELPNRIFFGVSGLWCFRNSTKVPPTPHNIPSKHLSGELPEWCFSIAFGTPTLQSFGLQEVLTTQHTKFPECQTSELLQVFPGSGASKFRRIFYNTTP